MSGDSIELSILLPAFIAGVLVIALHVPLGQIVLKKGIIFIDLAIAQIAGLGVIAAYTSGWDLHGWEVQIIATLSSVTGALFIFWLESKYQQSLEALIGVIFIVAASSGLLLLAHNPHGGEHLRDLLSGQILWVDIQQLLPVAALYALLLLIWGSLYRKYGQLGRLGFYIIFSLAVTASVQLVGVYLVFSSLIIPALAVRRVSNTKTALLLAYAVGIVAYALGLYVSAITDLPSGAVIVWALLVCAISIQPLIKGMIQHK